MHWKCGCMREKCGGSYRKLSICGEFEAIASLRPIEMTPRTLSPSDRHWQNLRARNN